MRLDEGGSGELVSYVNSIFGRNDLLEGCPGGPGQVV